MRYSLRICLVLLLCCFALLPLNLNAQFYETGREPAGTAWKTIKTEHFRVIIPETNIEQGKRIAILLENQYSKANKGLRSPKKKHKVIVHPYSAKSNGYVTLAPLRMELYPLPSQSMYAEEWLKQLSLHEYRHIVQIENLNTGITKLLSLVFGEQFAGAVLGLYLPLWFLEGDAVWAESHYSQAGRGRSSSFSAGWRAYLKEYGIPSFNKAQSGSYRTPVPDAYQLGYHIVSHARNKYGTDVWKESIAHVARNPWYPWTFAHSIKKNTGLSKRKLYQESMKYLDSLQTVSDLFTQTYDYDTLTRAGRNHCSYTSAVLSVDSSIIAIKSAMHKARQIVVLRNAKEKVLLSPGQMSSRLSISENNMLTWSEYRADPVYENRNYSDIYIYDITAGKKKRLSRKMRLFAPDISKNGTKIIASSFSSNTKNSLAYISDIHTDKKIEYIEIPDSISALNPVWEHGDTSYVFMAVSESGMYLLRKYLSSPTQEIIKGPFSYIVKSLRTLPGGLTYVSEERGKPDVYFYEYSSNTHYRLSDVSFSCSGAVVCTSSGLLYFSDYTAKGYQLVRQKLPISEILAKTDTLEPNHELCISPSFEMIRYDTSLVYEVSDYKKMANLFRLHSWGPLYTDPEAGIIRPGFSLHSHNDLSTLFAHAGYEYDMAAGFGQYQAGFVFRGWMPDISANASFMEYDAIHLADTKRYEYRHVERTLSFDISQPIQIRQSAYISRIRASGGMYYTENLHRGEIPNDLINTNISVFSLGFSAANYKRMSTRNLAPAIGQYVSLRHRFSAFGNTNAGSSTFGSATVLFPGIFANNSLSFTARFEKKQTGQYMLANHFMLPAGYNPENYTEYQYFGSSYSMPLLYPDLSIGSVLYINRLKSRLFFEYAEAKAVKLNKYYSSQGIDITADMHILRFVFPVEIGARLLYDAPNGIMFNQFLVKMSQSF